MSARSFRCPPPFYDKDGKPTPDIKIIEPPPPPKPPWMPRKD